MFEIFLGIRIHQINYKQMNDAMRFATIESWKY